MLHTGIKKWQILIVNKQISKTWPKWKGYYYTLKLVAISPFFSIFQLKLTWRLATFIFIIFVIVLALSLRHYRNYMHLKNSVNYHWTSHFLHRMSLIFSRQYLWPVCLITPSISEMWHLLYIFPFLSWVWHWIFTRWIKEKFAVLAIFGLVAWCCFCLFCSLFLQT